MGNKEQKLKLLKKCITTQKQLDDALSWADIDKKELQELEYEFEDCLEVLAEELEDWQVEDLYFDMLIKGAI